MVIWPSSEKNNRPSSFSSISSSTSSCPSPFSSSPLIPTPKRETMEEVWKDINHTDLQDNPTREQGRKNNFRGMILQEFLARPINQEPPTNADIYIGPFASTTPSPPTSFNLNLTPELQYLSTMGFRPLPNQCCGNASPDFNSGPSINIGQSSFSMKRAADSEKMDNSGDRQRKRMIKNRESAALSRARKQAYINDLEHKVAHLMEENAKLRKQQQQLCIAASSAQLHSKHTLYRTSTAPF